MSGKGKGGRGKKENESPTEVCRAAFGKHAVDGRIPMTKLSQLLKSLGQKTDCAFVVNVQGALQALWETDRSQRAGSLDEFEFELFNRWYVLETTPGRYKTNNTLLVKRVIAKSKLPTRDIPAQHHIYGCADTAVGESALDVVMNWDAGVRSESKDTGVSLLKINKAAVVEGHHTAKGFNRFMGDHRADKKMQKPRPQLARDRKKNAKRNDIQYTKSANQAYKEPMSLILFPGGACGETKEETYQDTSKQTKKGKLPLPRATKSSTLLQHLNESNADGVDSEPFKLSKFQNVECKVVTH